jgi:signal transduction histidine kinase/CheY-like chemotaxis protein
MRPLKSAEGWSLRATLATFPLAFAVIPLAVTAIVLTVTLFQAQKEEASREVVQSARALARAVLADLRSTERRLELLAGGDRLREGDVVGFHPRARAALERNTDWANLTLTDAGGRQLLNLLVAQGGMPPLVPREHTTRAIETGRPAVSGFFRSRLADEEAVAIAVPVEVKGTRCCAINARLSFESLDRLAESQQVRAQGVASVIDGDGRIVARSRDAARYRGELATDGLLSEIAAAPQGGTQRALSKDGVLMMSAWAPVGDTGWKVAVGVPVAVFDAPLARSLGWIAAAILAASLLSILGAWFFAREIMESVASAARQALALAQGVTSSAPASHFRELNRLAQALRRAGERLATLNRERAIVAAERDRLLASERAARELAEATSRGKDQFLAMLGHEMRNPLGAMTNAVALLARPDLKPDQAQQVKDILRRQSSHLARIVDDLLDVGRVLAGKIRVTREPLDLGELVRRSMETLEAAGKLGDHEVYVDLTPVWVSGDATRLDQILTNLVVNAVRHTPAQGAIKVGVRREGTDAVLEVTDSGAGIPPDLLPRIFDLFVQGEQHGRGDPGGLGIGLTLARRLVELQDGLLTASSPGGGKGATFTVRLPAVVDASADVDVKVERGVGGPSADVLLVEDNADLRQTVEACLTLDGHRVRAVADGASGIAAALEATPDVVVIDIGLPDIPGDAVARRLRERFGDDIRLLAVTGYGLPDVARDARRAGFDDCLFKPVDLAALSRRVSDLAAEVQELRLRS